ncbi:MAG: carboxypeptidase-like regulatory domain-containing protein [Saprospiraceae bacterium]|nr:carboxypeptidase-like regulatory domain-containing protein [Saprospiraceae bacterium]
MENKINIYACNQSWDLMPETEGGRLCERCNRCLIDFREMELAEMKALAKQQSDKHLCGIYRPDQVATSIPIHQRPTRKKGHWWAVAASVATAFMSISAVMPVSIQTDIQQTQADTPLKRASEPCCTIKGRVTDHNSGEPLIGADITLFGTEISTVSDLDGFFELDVFDLESKRLPIWTLVISSVGYTPDQVVISKENFQEFQEVSLGSPIIIEEQIIMGVMIMAPEDYTPKKRFFKSLFGKD